MTALVEYPRPAENPYRLHIWEDGEEFFLVELDVNEPDGFSLVWSTTFELERLRKRIPELFIDEAKLVNAAHELTTQTDLVLFELDTSNEPLFAGLQCKAGMYLTWEAPFELVDGSIHGAQIGYVNDRFDQAWISELLHLTATGGVIRRSGLLLDSARELVEG